MTQQLAPEYTSIPDVDIVKEFFKAGATPKQGEFESLVLLADYCRHILANLSAQSGLTFEGDKLAVKLAEDSGLTLSNKGLKSQVPKLEVAEKSGLKIENEQISILTETDSGLILNNDGLAVSLDTIGKKLVDSDKGLQFDETGKKIALKLAENGVLSADQKGLTLDGAKLVTDSKGLEFNQNLDLKINANGGLKLEDNNGLELKLAPSKGLEIVTEGLTDEALGLALKLKEDSALASDAEGLALKLKERSALTSDTDGLDIDWTSIVPALTDEPDTNDPDENGNLLYKKLQELESRLAAAEALLAQQDSDNSPAP
ncbi:hypothetical protein HG263_08355 [Pseudoalteromonas sp. JBTF-M23]|uniref:Uncharacterized protein n=1 Tax=Pseudoalteromonas caenipelagi TaxID=2726988 RepID=A0A849VB08_9GAMM|nr:hypothetical protein [Pseudoalteromonas caenipelagi]NOU50552.1 hypothetical protein [Pseudoalteromonas caenipelagi]